MALRKIKFEFNDNGFYYLNKQFDSRFMKAVEIDECQVRVYFDKDQIKMADGIVVIGPTLNFSKKYFVGKKWVQNKADFQVLKGKIEENRR